MEGPGSLFWGWEKRDRWSDGRDARLGVINEGGVATVNDTDRSLEIYMRDIGVVKLLTPEEEMALAIRAHDGDEEARDLLIRSNLRLVVKLAHEYTAYGMPLADLISEGNIGLMKAVEKFDPTRGCRLSTYSALWIKQSMRRALANQGKTIRVPCHLMEKVSKVRRMRHVLTEELGREPTIEELARELAISVKEIKRLEVIAMDPTSLDAPLGGDDDKVVGDLVKDENATTPYEDLERAQMIEEINALVEDLPERERGIIRQRFGIGPNKDEATLEDLGNQYRITRERVRQLQEKTVDKLRDLLIKRLTEVNRKYLHG